MTHVRPPTPADKPAWLRMRRALWPEDGDSHSAEIDQFFAQIVLENKEKVDFLNQEEIRIQVLILFIQNSMKILLSSI